MKKPSKPKLKTKSKRPVKRSTLLAGTKQRKALDALSKTYKNSEDDDN